MRTNYSTSAISLLKSGQRKLTPDFASAMARALGGTQALWLGVYSDATSERPKPVEHYLAVLGTGRPAVDVKLASGMRRLVNHEIYNLFAEGGDRSAFKSYFDAEGEDDPSTCHIQGFDPARIQFTSYDTSIGRRVVHDPDSFKVDFSDYVPQAGPIEIKPAGPNLKENSVILVSAEHFELPWFLEAEVHPAHTLSLKVSVGNGPVIDPKFNGFLCVRVTNPWPTPVTLFPDEAFLTVRFNLLTSLPLSDAAMKEAFGVDRYNARTGA